MARVTRTLCPRQTSRTASVSSSSTSTCAGTSGPSNVVEAAPSGKVAPPTARSSGEGGARRSLRLRLALLCPPRLATCTSGGSEARSECSEGCVLAAARRVRRAATACAAVAARRAITSAIRAAAERVIPARHRSSSSHVLGGRKPTHGEVPPSPREPLVEARSSSSDSASSVTAIRPSDAAVTSSTALSEASGASNGGELSVPAN
eukprot:scaffold68282_cov28-Tisochrysis_lutea.AAC.4